MTGFKVGDRVKASSSNIKGYGSGIGVVTVILPSTNFAGITVEFADKSRTYHRPDSLVLVERPASTFGMSSKDLADAVENTIRETRKRVEGVGDAQYSTDKGQKFEGLKVSELLRMAREEAQDLVVYAVMTDIRLARIEAAIEGEGL